jgi:flagellar hook assembly protein FlgD
VDEGSFDIKIFDIRSNVVRELRNNPSWDGKDEGGNRVESGTYVYRFEGQGVVVTGMVAVAR